MIELVRRLEIFLDVDGRFTFVDPHWVGLSRGPLSRLELRWGLQKRKEFNPTIDVEALLEKAKNAQWCTLVNDDDLYVDDADDGQRNAREKKAYVVFCTPEYMKTLFPDGEIKPPIKPERHHCCLIRRSSGERFGRKVILRAASKPARTIVGGVEAMSTANDYTFSVIIPSYNRARFLPQALESVWQQDVADVQVIVVDDGSTDDTRAVVARCGHKVHYLYQENRGTASARNAGVRLARGRFVSFLDSDDLWLPGKMQAELARFHELPMTDAIISDAERWMEGELVSPSWFEQVGFVLSPGQPVFMSQHPPLWIKCKPFATCSLTIRRTALEQLGAVPFDTSLRTHEDWDLAIRMHRACRVLILPHVFAQVRRFNDGTRVGRPLPGTPYPPDIEQIMMYRRYRILNRALVMEGWPKEVVKELESVAGETARKIAANYRRWRRPGLLTVLASEMRRGAFSNVFRVLALSLRVPWKGSPINTGSVHW